MKINDLRTDLESDVTPFPDYEKKELEVSTLWTKNTSDIFIKFEWINNDINISKNNNIKISKKKKNNFLAKIKFFDWINLVKKSKNIDISKPYNNRTEDLKKHINKISDNISTVKITSHVNNIKNDFKNDIKTTHEDILSSTQEFYVNNLKKKNHEFKNKKLRIKKQKSLLFKFSTSVLILLWFLVIFKFSVESSVNNGYKKLASIKDGAISFESVQKTINDAKFSFIFSDILFTPLSIIPNQSIDNWYHVIKWWKKITALADEFLHFFDGIQLLIQKKWIDNIYTSQVIENNKDKFLVFENLLSQWLIHYDKIQNIWDTKLQQTFDNTLIKLHKTLGYIKTINLNFDEFLALMWHNEIREYLIVFQNNDEIRPTWWFMWSMWIVRVYKWKVIEIKKSDVYAYEWEINKQYKQNNESKLVAPKWLNKITGTWGLRDSNYNPMIKDSAADIKSFLDRINVNIDGIIFINKWTIEEILAVSGWIEFDQLWEKITDENFSRIISTLVEAKVSKVWTLWTPKQILFDFAESFYKQMKDNNDYIPYAKVIFNNLNSRDIIIYSFHSDENSLLWKLGLNWEIAFHKSLDFAYPVFTSISWNKSDRYIKTQFNKTTEEIWKCSYQTNLEIIRKHQYNNLEEEKIDILLDKHNIQDKEHIRYIQWKWDNYQFVRIFLPKNAVIEPELGLIIQEESRYKIAEFYIKTRLYETTKNNIKYTINKPNCKWYSYKLYKQPGIKAYDMNIEINWEKISAKNVQKDFVINR